MILGAILGAVFLLAAAVQGDGKIDKSKQCPKHVIQHADREIQSPVFGILPAHFRCWYNVTAPEGKIAKLHVDVLDFPAPVDASKINKAISKTCLYDYIEFFDKEDASLGRFCGSLDKGTSNLLKEVNFNEQTIKLLFHTYNGNKNMKGFKMTTKFAKGGNRQGRSAEEPCYGSAACDAEFKHLEERDAEKETGKGKGKGKGQKKGQKKPKKYRLLGDHYGALSCGGQAKISRNESTKSFKTPLKHLDYSCMWDVMIPGNVKSVEIQTKLPVDANQCKSSQFQVVFLKNNKYIADKWISDNCEANKKVEVQMPQGTKKVRAIVFAFAELKQAVNDKKMTLTLTRKSQKG